MEIYILKYQDFDWYDNYEYVKVIGAFTKQALDRELQRLIEEDMKLMMEDYEEEYQSKKRQALAIKEKAKQEVKELCYQMDSMNELIEDAKADNDEKTYRALLKERRKLGRKMNQISRKAKYEAEKIEKWYVDLKKEIASHYKVESMDLIE